MIAANFDKFRQEAKVLEEAIVKMNSKLEQMMKVIDFGEASFGGLTTEQVDEFMASLDVESIQTAFNAAKETFTASTPV